MLSPSEIPIRPLPESQFQMPNVAVEMTAEERRRHALMFLGAIKKDITSEKLPLAIDALINAYTRMGQNENAILPESIANNILTLQNIVDDKLLKLENGKTVFGRLTNVVSSAGPGLRNLASSLCQRVTSSQSTPNYSQGHFQARRSRDSEWQLHASAREEMAAAVGVIYSSAVQQTSAEDLELVNGERLSEIVTLSRSLNFAIDSEINGFMEVFRVADKFDRVCHSAFGLSFYSDEFIRFCALMADAAQDFQNCSPRLEGVLRAVEFPAKREHMREMTLDQNLRNQFEQLKKFVLKDHLYKIIALVLVNDILTAVPVNFKKHSTQLFLESLQLACKVFLLTQLSETDSAWNRAIREGIQNLMRNLHLIKVCAS